VKTNVENREDNPVEEYDGEASINSSPPWAEEWRGIEGSNLTPIEGYDTHAEAMNNTEQLVDLDIIRSDPAYPRKVGESREKVRGKEVCDISCEIELASQGIYSETDCRRSSRSRHR
jgi:hypothetical protein